MLREGGVEVVAHVRRGRLDETARAVLQAADELSADLIEIGSSGPSAFDASMLGGSA